MKEYFSIKFDKKEKIVSEIRNLIYMDESVLFVYLFGSFLNNLTLRDIDIGVYLKNIKQDKVDHYEVELSRKISKVIEMPFDIIEVKILNFAPVSFLNSIFKNGKLLFSRNDELLSGLIEESSIHALFNEYIREQSLKELVPK